MKILFVMEMRDNAGSVQAAANYARAAEEMGHTIAVYGRPDPAFPTIRFSAEPDKFDYVLFIVESRLEWMSGLRLSRILSRSPRSQRVILDADGMYNRAISIDDYDRNHASETRRESWLAFYHELSDRIIQPTLRPFEPGVIGFAFYGYDETAEMNGNAPKKRYDIVHVGHNWWRWQEVSTALLPAIERIRSRVGTICFLGLWWDGVPPWAAELGLKQAVHVDPERFRQLRIQVEPPVPYTNVISAMSRARVNIMTQRPLFRHLNLLTSKYFEIFCADTIPLVMLHPDQAEAVYGPAGRELALHQSMGDKLLDALEHPVKYRALVQQVRQHLTHQHSYQTRVEQLVAALQGRGDLLHRTDGRQP